MDLDRLGQVALDEGARVVAGADAVIVVQHVVAIIGEVLWEWFASIRNSIVGRIPPRLW